MIAQTILAILFAMATVATRGLTREQVGEARGHCLRVVQGAADQRCCADDKELAQLLVAHLGDATELFFAAARVLKRS
jgi:hypothetical protein